MPVFIQCCNDKIYGNRVYVNINLIVSFEKHIKLIPNEQWYLIKIIDGTKLYTLYDFTTQITYNLPDL